MTEGRALADVVRGAMLTDVNTEFLEKASRACGVCAAGGRISPPPIPGSSVLDVPFVDYGAHALRSIEGLLDTLCEIAQLPADEIKRTPPPRSVLRRDSDDAAKGALRSLSGIASLIVEKAPVSW